MNISIISRGIVCRGILCILLAFLPISAWSVILQKIEASSLPGDIVELRLTFDDMAPAAHGYSIAKPPKISIDLPYTRNKLPKYNEIGLNNVDNVTVLETGDRTRLVIHLESPAQFTSQTDENALSIYIGQQPTQSSFEREVGDAVYSNYQADQLSKGIQAIDFQRGDDGEGKVLISMDNAKIASDINEENGRIRLEFQGDIIPHNLRNRLDVIDFGTVVHYIEATVEDGKSIITIEPKGRFEYLAYQTDDLMTISVKAPDVKKRHSRHDGLTYTGEKLSLNFQDIEVRAVLQVIADFTNLNLVASDTVGGNVTLRLQDVPWDQALDIVLKAKGLDKRLEGNVLTVAPAAEIAARERAQLENARQIRDLAPLYTDLVQINYADAGKVATVLEGNGDNRVLTDRGSVQVVERTNSLLIKDTQSKLDEIRALIEQLDIPIRQVMIEARIVTLTNKYRNELGVKWGGTKDNVLSSNRQTLGGNLFTDLSTASTADSGLAIGFSSNGANILDLELSAVLSDGGGEVISQPKVITADKQKAIIKSGQEVAFEEKTSSGATSVAFKDAVLGLEVTPQITPDGRVIMDIKVNNDDFTKDSQNSIPIISTNEITTQVLVEDGQTVILGGVFKQVKNKTTRKVPLLGDMPLLGALFRNKEETDDKDELMVFITPRIITDDVSLR